LGGRAPGLRWRSALRAATRMPHGKATQASNSTLPPAAAVLIVTVLSTLKR
jgi:hypothetical protein